MTFSTFLSSGWNRIFYQSIFIMLNVFLVVSLFFSLITLSHFRGMKTIWFMVSVEVKLMVIPWSLVNPFLCSLFIFKTRSFSLNPNYTKHRIPLLDMTTQLHPEDRSTYMSCIQGIPHNWISIDSLFLPMYNCMQGKLKGTACPRIWRKDPFSLLCELLCQCEKLALPAYILGLDFLPFSCPLLLFWSWPLKT